MIKITENICPITNGMLLFNDEDKNIYYCSSNGKMRKLIGSKPIPMPRDGSMYVLAKNSVYMGLDLHNLNTKLSVAVRDCIEAMNQTTPTNA